MAGRCVELLVVLTGTLLLASVWGWQQLNEQQLRSLYKTGLSGEMFTSLDDISDYDDYEYEDKSPEEVPEVEAEVEAEVEGVASETLEPFDDYGLQVDTEDFGSKNSPRCPSTKPSTSTPSKAHNCAVPTGERVTCGHPGISFSDCEKMGCCVCLSRSTCYYPMDECTADRHFIFAIRYNSADIPVDPTKLVIPGSTGCKPVIVNNEVAIFMFKVTECGTRVYEIGETKIYLAEVQTIVQALALKYGIITRSDPLRFIVECRYSKRGNAQQSLASVGYMVKIPPSSLPSKVVSHALYSVQLRIAKDHTYSSFYPTYHPPLRLLLGSPVYLELRLKSPKPDAVLLVNYCLAFPRSARNALVLVNEGCANLHDQSVAILVVKDLPNNRHQRRFMVEAFEFMVQRTNTYLDEEIYFMCSVEVCWLTERTCEERCFDGKIP